MAHALTSAYDAYAAALRDVDLVVARAGADERAEAEQARTREVELDRRVGEVRSTAEAVLRARDGVARKLADLPITVPAARSTAPPSSSDPLALAEQLVRRADGVVDACREDLAAIERQRARVAEARAGDDAQRRQAEAERLAREHAARERAAAGDRVLLGCAGAIALCAVVAGLAGPPGSGVLLGIVLAAAAALVARSRPSNLAARIGGSFVAVFALGCAIAGIAALGAALARGSGLDTALAGAAALLAALGFWLVTHRPTGAPRP